jgi:hypothetical protein
MKSDDSLCCRDRLQFNSSLREVLHGLDPFLTLGMDRSANDSFQRLT